MASKKPIKKAKPVEVEDDDLDEEVVEDEEADDEPDVDVEELPGGGTRETVRASRRYSK